MHVAVVSLFVQPAEAGVGVSARTASAMKPHRTAAIVFIVHQIVGKASLFLVGGLVEETAGSGAIDEVDGVARTRPLLGVLFLLPALSLAGFPPFSGFIGKLALVQAGFGAGRWLVVGVSLAASVLTLFSMTKIWTGVFWGSPSRTTGSRPVAGMTVATAALVVGGLAVAAVGEPLYAYAERAAASLLDADAYRTLVLGAAR